MTAITITKEVPKDSASSYDFLREEGIKTIQQLAGTTWTDHNIHDPGITILEQLCYAISDLAYRIDYDIKDLLGRDDHTAYDNLFSPAAILTVNPVTLLDLRKIVVDEEGVKNAWIEKITNNAQDIDTTSQEKIRPKGLYRVLLEKDTLVDITGNTVVGNVRAKLQKHRSVCEDFEEVKLLDTQLIRLEGTIEISDSIDDVNQLVANLLCRVDTHFSPRVSFYTLQELLEKGKRTDEIFDGPPLKHGFVDDEELLQFGRKTEIQTSDVIREIMDEPGVLIIDRLAVATGIDTVKNWILPLDPDKTPRLDFEGTLGALKITSKGLNVTIDTDFVRNLYTEKRKEGLPKEVSLQERDIVIPGTESQHIENYYSIQNQFPSNYGIGTIGLPDSASETRKAQAKQLTSYLTLFEQILANYFSQVANFKNLMSFDGKDTRTYFNQSLLTSVSGIEEVLKSKEGYEDYLKEMTADSTEGLQRKNKFLNHLLARFAEKFNRYGMLLQDIPGNPNTADKKLIKDKATFLKEYPVISAGRAKAYDYTQTYWQNDNISVLEKRIARKLGIEEYTRRNLGDGDTEGFHMVEHILLRPRGIYPYPLDVRYSPGKISSFEAVENKDHARCFAIGHDLKEGEKIQILGNEIYPETYTIVATEEDHFEIDVPFKESTTTGFWQRILDIRYFIKTSNIESFEASPSSGHTFCKAKKNMLKEGDLIEITQTQDYDGIHEVIKVTEEGFEIPVAFNENNISGRWMPIAGPTDPYSLQLTFVVPKWTERYQDEEFKKFVENTIREETPAHIITHIKWLDQNEMQGFDKAFHSFLSRIRQ